MYASSLGKDCKVFVETIGLHVGRYMNEKEWIFGSSSSPDLFSLCSGWFGGGCVSLMMPPSKKLFTITKNQSTIYRHPREQQLDHYVSSLITGLLSSGLVHSCSHGGLRLCMQPKSTTAVFIL
jgi:hypothetical protein